MSNRYQQAVILLVLLGIYGLLFYFIFTYHQKLDFYPFYSSTLALLQGENPYTVLSANLNPPIVLWLFTPLACLSYSTALFLWSIFSFILGLIGAGFVFHYAVSARFVQKNRFNLYLLYLSFFPTLMNVTTLQLGALLLFFIMLGYHFYLNHRNNLAGILWGIIIAMKLFPALLFFYALKQRRFKVFGVMLVTFVIASLIPLLVYGSAIYKTYYAMMSHVLWYGDGWNASIYGFIFRIFVDRDNLQSIVPIELLYAFLFFILLLWYLKKLGPKENNQVNHQPFCLTLVMMLLMSPLGWVYYFPLLIFPLILLWSVIVDEQNTSTKTMILWLICLFLLNFPLDYVKTKSMANLFTRISVFSCYFYGLVLLTYLIGQRKIIPGKYELHIKKGENYPITATVVILVFGLSVPTLCFIMRLSV